MNVPPSYSLQSASMVKIVTYLIQRNIPENLKIGEYSQWSESKAEEVESEILRLEFPIECQIEMTRMVKLIFWRIRKANNIFSEHLPSTNISCIHECIQMTPWGPVDMKQSAVALLDLRVEELPKLMRYKLSCIFCLQDQFASCYEDLDEEDRMRLPSLLNQLYVAAGEPQSFTNFEYAVINGNEVAARHFWNAEENLQHPAKLIKQIHAYKLNFHQDTLWNLYLFLLSCYPDNVPLQEALLDSVPFLVSLLDWAYLDTLMELFHRMPEERRYLNMGSLIYAVFEISSCRRMDGDRDYVDTLQYFLKGFFATDEGLTTTNSQAGNSLIPFFYLRYVDCCENGIELDDFWAGWSSQWQRIIIYNIDMVLFKMPKCDENNFRFVRMLLELLEKSHKVRYCELRAKDIADLILAYRHPRMALQALSDQ